MARTKKMEKPFTTGAKVYAVFIAIYVLLLAVGAGYLLSKVWIYAKEYEASRPEKVMDPYMETLLTDLQDSGIAQTITAMPHEVQSDTEVEQVIRQMLNGELSYSRKSGGGEESSIVYNLRCGGKIFGQVTLIQDESYADELEFGLLPWKIYKEEFDFTGLYSSMQITIPASYSVRLNGQELGSEYIIEDGLHYDVLESYYSDYPGLPTKVTYRFENIIGELEPQVFDEDGNEFSIDPAQDDSQFIKEVTGETAARFQSFAENFTARYREYIAGIYSPDYGYSRLGPYIQLGGDLDDRLKKAMDGISWSHTSSITMESVTLNSAIDIGNNFYILDVSSIAVAVQPREGSIQQVRNSQSAKLIVTDVGNDIRAVTMELYENTEL